MHKVIDYINANCDLDEEYFKIFGRKLPNGKFTCPNPNHLHKSNTPSCKKYGNVFKCFGQCNRVFGVYDLLKWYNPKRIEELKSQVLMDAPESPKTVKINKVQGPFLNMVDALEKITGVCL